MSVSSKFIVFEGLDCSGKTSVINKILPYYENGMYSKFMGGNNIFGKLADITHFTSLYLIEIIYLSLFSIRPNMKKNRYIFQDRYIYSMLSFRRSPLSFYHKLLYAIARLFVVKPDLLILLTVTKKERIMRLAKNKNVYHLFLINNPRVIAERDNEFLKLYNKHVGKKVIVDTSNLQLEDVKNYITKKINSANSMVSRND